MTENCEGYFGGAGVLFDGEYTRQKVSEEILADTYLQGILETKGLVIKIKNELGSLFTSMVFCLHLVSDEKCIDPFPAKVIVGCVRGICPDMAAILMYTTDGQFYIAWYNGEGLSYVSPDARYKKKLPKTIARWMKQYEGVRVNFL